MNVSINLEKIQYEIIINKGLINNIEKYIDFTEYENILVITDDNIPSTYLKKMNIKDKQTYSYMINHGESSKCFETYSEILKFLIEKDFSRHDLIIALGGGVVGDLAGFVASTYKRGIDFINIPLSLLSMVDSSIGGKNAINLGNVKNAIGSFYSPKKVLIDLDCLDSLPNKEFTNGLMEALKCALLMDSELFRLFQENDKNTIRSHIEEVIVRSLKVKSQIIEEDYLEKNIRRYLNFGHTIGHALELNQQILHGEAVDVGMLCYTKIPGVNLREILRKYINIDSLVEKAILIKRNTLKSSILNDKKACSDHVSIIIVNEIGKPEIIEKNVEEIMEDFYAINL